MPDKKTTIKSLKSFSGAGVWKAYTDNAGKIELATKTLIYGFNGSGKTTFSRIFASIQDGKIAEHLPADCSFELQLSDEGLISTKQIENPISSSILVFNQDFITQNFLQDESKAEPIFYISEEDIDKKREYDTAIVEREIAQNTAKETQSAETEAEKKCRAFYTGVGQRVRDLAPKKRYSQSFNATQVRKAYSEREYTDDDLLESADIVKKQALLNQDEALPKLNEISGLSFDLVSWEKDKKNLLETTLGIVLSGKLSEHSDALDWVHRGLKYHESHDIDSCLLCGNKLSEERKSSLAKIFDSTWNEFTSRLNQGKLGNL